MNVRAILAKMEAPVLMKQDISPVPVHLDMMDIRAQKVR